MSLEDAMSSFTRGRRRKYGPIDLTKPPTKPSCSTPMPARPRRSSWPG